MPESGLSDSTGDAEAVSSVEFVYVDVFASTPLTGAPLTLVTDADGLSDDQMRAVAREFNQSETTFVQRPSRTGATRRLRSFTPTGEEVFGAGHNALGAWLWLASSGQLSFDAATSTFAQEIGDEILPVHVTRTDGRPLLVTMDQSPPVFGAVVADRAELATALGLQDGDLVDDRPAQVVSTGAGHLLVAARSRGAVDRAVPDVAQLTTVLQRVNGEGCYLYTHDTVDAAAAAYARFFNPAMGIAEDPATGTAAGPLAALLVANGIVTAAPASEATVVIEQGHSMGRPSTITVTVNGPRVQVSGSGLVVAHGTLSVRGENTPP
jgi:trans-2,3-dihydro-3-hydroxyanthranilate isomerase